MDSASFNQSTDAKSFSSEGVSEAITADPSQDLSQVIRLYSSKDGLLSIYQDAEGHLVSVDTRKFCN